jgi:hypothetical protein
LAITAVFDQGSDLGKISQGRFEPGSVGHRSGYKIPARICLVWNVECFNLAVPVETAAPEKKDRPATP